MNISLGLPRILKALLWGATLTLAVGCTQNGSRPIPEASAAPRPLFRTLSAERPVDPARELMITDLSVVEDAVRTTYVAGVTNGSDARGAWSFGRLMEQMADGRDLSSFTLNWLRKWEVDQNINGFVSAARPLVRSSVIDPWLTASNCAAGATTCKLDFSRAPFRLLAIASRLDLRELNAEEGDDDLEVEHAGEGRFIFGVVRQDGTPMVFTVIFEYELLADEIEDVAKWANRWHALGGIASGPAYNTALQEVTRRFVGRNVASNKPNGSAINQIRTNEASLGNPGSDPANLPSTKLWELREFVLSRSSGQLLQTTVKQNPDLSFNGTQFLADYIRNNEAALLAGKHVVPAQTLGASAFTPKNLAWTAPGVNESARKQFALATCSGCHLSETNTNFLHIGRRTAGVPSVLSSFLAGELNVRAADFSNLLNDAERGDDVEDGDDKGKAH